MAGQVAHVDVRDEASTVEPHVSEAHLRGRFAELRAQLDIIRGDARYASTGIRD